MTTKEAFISTIRAIDPRDVLGKMMAERTGAAVVLVRHLNKRTDVSNALYRGGGSIGLSGTVDSNKDQDIRKVLTKFAAYRPRPGRAQLGTSGIIAAARIAYLVGPNRDPGHRVFASVKNNLAKMPPSLAFRLIEVPMFHDLRQYRHHPRCPRPPADSAVSSTIHL
jgi:hypothetical protein